MNFIVYISAATYLMDENELKEILEVSRKNNQSSGITGLLLYHEGNFIQVLEGEKTAINALYDKITIDNRHVIYLKCCRVHFSSATFLTGLWASGAFPQPNTRNSRVTAI
jgi:hypothetical protein